METRRTLLIARPPEFRMMRQRTEHGKRQFQSFLGSDMLFGHIIHDLCWNNTRENCDAKKVTLWTLILLDKEKIKLDFHA